MWSAASLRLVKGGDGVRVAIIYRPRNPAPIEAVPMLMGALGEWVETHSKRATTLEFFVIGGGLVIADFDDAADVHRIVAENPFTPYMDVEIMPVARADRRDGDLGRDRGHLHRGRTAAG